MTGPAVWDHQVGTKCTITQNGKYLEFCAQYLLSESCKILPINLFINGKSVISIVLADY